jgi:iron-sulfur cluster repair protein YtfE (RIC family)
MERKQSGQLVIQDREVRSYIEECNRSMMAKLFSSAGSHLRTVVARDLNSHPKLLFIYNQFAKVRELSEQHLHRKQQLLFPLLDELIRPESKISDQVKLLKSFIDVFKTESDKIKALMDSIAESTDGYSLHVNANPLLVKAFGELTIIADELRTQTEIENNLFERILRKEKTV